MKEYKYKINGNVYKVAIGDIEDNIAHVEVNGTPYKVEMEKAPKVVVKPVARPAATSAPAAPATPVVKPAAASTGKSGVKSPLPGVILDIKVNVGDTVKKGQVIIILEAMKMENNINADKDGKITAINVNKGDSVLEGTDLVSIQEYGRIYHIFRKQPCRLLDLYRFCQCNGRTCGNASGRFVFHILGCSQGI